MTHRSRLGCVVIDCETDDLSAAASFWGAALGHGGTVDAEGPFGNVTAGPAEPRLILQKVSHPSRVHIDIETDDRGAEARRLETLGARVVATHPGWIVMEAPTGHRFCLVPPQRPDFDANAITREAPAARPEHSQ